jgi:subtilisin family serine protease
MRHVLELRRRENLFARIEESRRSNESLELIIGSSPGRQEELAKRFRGIGKVGRVYGLIPFLSLRTGPEEASQLAGYVHRGFTRQRLNPKFERSYRKELALLSSVEASSMFKSTPTKRGNVFRSLEVDSLWNLENIGAYNAQDLSTGEGVKIAVIDTGVDYNHPDLRDRFENNKGYDFVRNSNEPLDREGHGSHVAGTACSASCGVSLDSTLYSVRVLDENGSGSEADIIAGIEYCIQNDMDVANMSLGASNASRAFEAICGEAYNRGLMLVAAAGNEGYGPEYPAAFGQSVVAVASVDSDSQHSDFSNVWETNDISAPGEGIVSCRLGGGYMVLSGTSMASPHVTGSIALGLSVFREEPARIEDYLEESAQALESDGSYDPEWVFGAGMVRADRLLAKIVEAASRRMRR